MTDCTWRGHSLTTIGQIPLAVHLLLQMFERNIAVQDTATRLGVRSWCNSGPERERTGSRSRLRRFCQCRIAGTVSVASCGSRSGALLRTLVCQAVELHPFLAHFIAAIGVMACRVTPANITHATALLLQQSVQLSTRCTEL